MPKSRSTKWLFIIPIFAFLVLIPILAVLDFKGVFEPPFLLLILNGLLISLTSFVVAYISARCYLMNGSINTLLLGSGSLVFGTGSLVTGWIMGTLGGANASVTMFNICALLASGLQISGAALTTKGVTSHGASKYRKQKLLVDYLGLLLLLVLLAVATLAGYIPLFFIQGTGPTLLRQIVLGAAIALFAITSILLMRLYLRSKSDILYWYSLGVGAISLGLFGVFLPSYVGGLLSWTGRIAQYLGCTYLLVSVLVAFKGTRTQEV